MKKVILTGATAPIAEKKRIDNKVSREHLTITANEAIDNGDGGLVANPFREVKRTLFQRHNADGSSAAWRQTPAQIDGLIKGGLAIPGSIETRDVEAYPVLGADGKQNKTKDGKPVFANSFTALVFEGESVEKVFAAAGKKLVKSSSSVSAKQDASLLSA